MTARPNTGRIRPVFGIDGRRSPPNLVPMLPGDDGLIAERIRAGDTAAFESLFVTYYAPLLGYLTRQLGHGDRDLAEDLIQAVFLDLWDRRERFHPAMGIRAYLYTAARHRFLNYRRGERRAADRLVRYTADTDEHESVSDPLTTMQRAALDAAVQSAIASLPPRARETFALHRDHGLSYQEIAALMAVSVNTVKTQMVRAVAAIRAAAAPFAGTLAIFVIERSFK